jgi:3-oxoacyl-[acyl-carrier protein] reductase
MGMLLSNKVAIITGGARGIGRGIALKFADEGCSIVIADVLMAEAKRTAEEVTQKGREGVFFQCDVSNGRQVQEMVNQALKKFGKVDILVNNAGIGLHPGPITAVSEEDWDRVLAINLKGVFLCCKAVVPSMQKKRYGKIINISSIGGIAPPSPNVHYCSAKAGVLGLTLDLALELAAFNICVNAILPGPTHTEMWEELISGSTQGKDLSKVIEEIGKATVPMQRVGTPEDIAGVALFFASELSGFVTGDRIIVGGGLPLRMRYAAK